MGSKDRYSHRAAAKIDIHKEYFLIQKERWVERGVRVVRGAQGR